MRVLELRVEYRFDARGNWVETVHQRYRVENREGVEHWGSIGASWSPWYMARPEMTARVLDPDGGERLLEAGTIAESARYPDLPDVYSDGKVLRAPLPGVRVGAIVEEKLVTKTTKPFFAGAAHFDVIFQGGVPRDKVELVVDVPETLPLRHELLDAKVSVEDRTSAGRRRLSFRGGPYAAIEPIDEFAPPELSRWPSVAFSTGESWQRLAREYAAILEAKLEKSDLADLAARTVAAAEPREVKVMKLLRESRRRVRYAAVEFGQAAIIPDEPRDTLSRAYGDCKDQATLLVALLRAAGIDATVALLLTGPGEDVRPGLPALDVFDHMIVFVPGDEPIWIDPTATYSRAGELPLADQGRLALIIDEDTTALTRTPTGTAAANTYREIREVRLQPFGPAVVKEVSTATGIPEQRLRADFTDPDQDLRRGMKEYVKSAYQAEKLRSASYGDPEDLSGPYQVAIEAAEAAVGDTELFGAGLDTSYSGIFAYLPELFWQDRKDTERREVDLLLPFAHRAEIAYHVIPPADFALARQPQFKAIAFGPARLTRSVRTRPDGVVELRFAFEVDKQRLSPDEVQTIKKGLTALDVEESTYLEFEHVAETQIQARQTAKGLRMFRALVDKAPTDPLARQRLAINLLEAGFGDAASKEARAAVALAPDCAVAHRTLGIVLSSDEFGREFARGYDREGAMAALRRAVTLNQGDVYSKVQLGLLLDHDSDGRRYADRNATLEAARHYDTIPEEELRHHQDGAFLHNGLYSLFWSEQFAEVHRRAKDRKPGDVPPVLAIGAAAMQLGAPAAIDEADRLGLRAEQRSETLADAADALYSMSHYAQAAALMSAASTDSANAALYANRARLMRALQRVDARQLRADTPEGAAKKAMVLVAGDGLLDPRLRRELKSTRAPLEPMALAYGLLGGSLYADLPRAVMADVLAATIRTTAEGNDQAGHRVRVSLDIPGATVPPLELFVVKEGGAYRLRASNFETDELGCEAHYLLGEKKEPAARRWLEWAAEHVRSASGDDPLRVHPFNRVWANGRGDLALAAAVLCAGGSRSASVIEVLETARARAGADSTAIDHALATAAADVRRFPDMLEAARRLVQLHPQSASARELELRALRGLRRDDEAIAVLQKALGSRKSPGAERTDLLRELAAAQQRKGELEAARSTMLRIVEEGQASAGVYNDLAWNGLFTGAKVEEMLEHALRASEADRFVSAEALHTLACVYLAAGKAEEARQTLNQLLERRPGKQPFAIDWYVIGGVAEAYGLPEVARAAYGKLTPTLGERDPVATYQLARKRLAALNAASSRASRSAPSSSR